VAPEAASGSQFTNPPGAPRPPALVPIGPDMRDPPVQKSPMQLPQDKPPPFRLIGDNPPPDLSPLKSAPLPATDPLPPGAMATPCLTLARSGPANVKAGQSFAYEIVVRNVGSLPAQARLEEELPAGTKLVTAQPMPVVQGDHLTWNLESLAAGAEQRYKVEVEVGRGGDWKANATLIVAVTSAWMAAVTGAPAQPLTMTGPATVPVGHAVPLTIRVTNTTGETLNNAVLCVQMSTGLQHLHGSAIEGPLGDLAPGQVKEVTLETYALQTGRLVADARLLAGRKSVAPVQTTVGAVQVVVQAAEQPTLAIRQTGPMSPAVGSECEFKLEVANRASAAVREVQVNDVLPEGLQFLTGDGAQYDPAMRAIRWNVGTLQPGQSRQMSFRAQVRAPGPQLHRVSAQALSVPEAQLNTILRVGGGR
jgi:uncharacterized repeat protein (TIGR01451 family)